MSRRGTREGSIYRRNDGYWVGAMSLAAGRRKVVYAKTRGEVAERMKGLLKAAQDGVPVATARLTVGAYLRRWINGAEASVRPSTHRRYEGIVRCQLIPHLGPISLTKLSPTDLGTMYAALLGEGLAPRTVGHAHRVLGRALREAEVAGLVGRNVARLVRPPRVPQKEMQTFTAEQARTLLRACEAGGERLATLYAVALATGAREGELLVLRWKDVDWDAGAIRIRRTMLRTRSGLQIGEPKTASARRTIPLGRATMEALRGHRLTQAEERLGIGLGPATVADLVFASKVGTLIDPSNLLANSYYPLLNRIGLPRLTFHALRHTAATLMLEAGTHIRVAAERLGHSDPGVTLRVYSHVSATMQREAADTLDRVLGA